MLWLSIKKLVYLPLTILQAISAIEKMAKVAVKFSDLIKTYEDSTTSGDFGDWLAKLELVAKLQKVDDLTTFLPLFLSGSAFAVYKQLGGGDKEDYTKLKKALLTAFSVNSFSAYEQLRVRTLVDGETVDVYLADLQRLVALIGQENSEPLLKCAFVAGLSYDLAAQLKSIAAVEDLALHELVSRTRMMHSVHSTSGALATCAVAQRHREVKCYHCAGPHLSRNCRSNKKEFTARREVKCYNCDEIGHIRRYCPKLQGNENGEVCAPDARPM